jgi:thioesterase domain-containing protein
MIANAIHIPAAGPKLSGIKFRGRGRRTLDADNLVPLKPLGERPPLFCFHPIDGELRVYRNLVEQMPEDLPVYGLRAGNPHEAPGSMLTLAERYADAILEAAPMQPYRFVGFSLGAIVAMHVAAAMEDRGALVESVALIDCRPIDSRLEGAIRDYLVDYIVTVQNHYSRRSAMMRELPPAVLHAAATQTADHFLSDDRDTSTDAIVEYLRQSPLFVRGLRAELVRPFVERLFARSPLLKTSNLRRLAAPLLVWRAWDGIGVGRDSWSAWTEAWCEESVLPGNHLTMMQPPSVGELARQLSESLDEFDGVALPAAAAAAK